MRDNCFKKDTACWRRKESRSAFFPGERPIGLDDAEHVQVRGRTRRRRRTARRDDEEEDEAKASETRTRWASNVRRARRAGAQKQARPSRKLVFIFLFRFFDANFKRDRRCSDEQSMSRNKRTKSSRGGQKCARRATHTELRTSSPVVVDSQCSNVRLAFALGSPPRSAQLATRLPPRLLRLSSSLLLLFPSLSVPFPRKAMRVTKHTRTWRVFRFRRSILLFPGLHFS